MLFFTITLRYQTTQLILFNMETMNDFILKFGKYKGQNFMNTPKSYQDWLLAQDWFKLPAPPTSEAKYDVIRKFVREYVMGMGVKYEKVLSNLSWTDANLQVDELNLMEIDDITDYYYIQPSK